MHTDQAAADNKKFIDGFLVKFPEYKTRDFYLTSESYGGHYLPTLAQVLGLSKGLGFRSPFEDSAVGGGSAHIKAKHYTLPPKPLIRSWLRVACPPSRALLSGIRSPGCPSAISGSTPNTLTGSWCRDRCGTR
jgi:hypothetical protein